MTEASFRFSNNLWFFDYLKAFQTEFEGLDIHDLFEDKESFESKVHEYIHNKVAYGTFAYALCMKALSLVDFGDIYNNFEAYRIYALDTIEQEDN